MRVLDEIRAATHAYAGYCYGCGAMTAAAVDYPSARRENARFVAELVRDGRRVERVTIEAVRGGLQRCTCQPAPAAQGELALAGGDHA